MDISEKYVIMCQKAKEVQERWEQNYDDKFVQGMGRHLIFYTIHTSGDRPLSRSASVWLLRIDQLLAMIDPHPIRAFNFFVEFWWTSKEQYHWDYPGMFETVEQHLLGYVMKSKYGKTWDEKTGEWVSIKEWVEQ